MAIISSSMWTLSIITLKNMGCKLEDVLQAYEIYDKVIHGALGDANLIYKSAAKMNGFTKTLNHEG